MTDEELYHELTCYTLAHPDPSFIHQHVVDAYAAQHADETTKPIGIVFALAGLYLYLEKDFTGRQVQKAHMRLANHRKQWEQPTFPLERGAVVISDVVAAPAGEQRDALIREWCASVWSAWREDREQVIALVRSELDVT
jgi:hypothetical protein